MKSGSMCFGQRKGDINKDRFHLPFNSSLLVLAYLHKYIKGLNLKNILIKRLQERPEQE